MAKLKRCDWCYKLGHLKAGCYQLHPDLCIKKNLRVKFKAAINTKNRGIFKSGAKFNKFTKNKPTSRFNRSNNSHPKMQALACCPEDADEALGWNIPLEGKYMDLGIVRGASQKIAAGAQYYLERDKRWFQDGVSLIFLTAESKRATYRRCRNYSFAVRARDGELARKMDQYIEEMLAANILEYGQTIINAPLFPIWKRKDAGTIRPIYDCRMQNKQQRGKGFWLPDISHFIMMRGPGDKLCKMDLTNAYWHLPIILCHRKYLGIKWGRIYRWTVLPFGLRTAPYVFQKPP